MIQSNVATTLLRLDVLTVLVVHGLDLLHIVIGFFAPKLAVLAMAIAGPPGVVPSGSPQTVPAG